VDPVTKQSPEPAGDRSATAAEPLPAPAPTPGGPAPLELSAEVLQERRLLQRLHRGDDQAFATIVRLNQQRIFNLVFRMLGNRQEAEDVAQDVFVSAFQVIHTFRGESRLSTWLYRIAINHCKNRLKYLKRRSKHRGRPLDDLTDHDMATSDSATGSQYHAHIPRPDDQVAGQQLEVAIQSQIAALDEEHRALVILRDIQGLSYQEISEVTGLNVGTVKSRLHRARLELKEALAPHM
jgi:RNA polymerase sigma-70 factor (ECF subfamily)